MTQIDNVPESNPIRVAFFGNVANCLFEIASALREESLFEPHLFIDENDGFNSRPESAQPSLIHGYPDWIHEGRWITGRSVLMPWRAAITRELAAFDLVVVSGPGPIFAQFSGRPWCWWVSGGDLTVKPFPLTFLDWYPGVAHKIGEIVGGVWQRRAARRASQLWVQPFAPMVDALERLDVPDERVATEYFPLIVDTEEFRPDRGDLPEDDPAVQRALAADFVVFHPSRFLTRRSRRRMRSGQYKGNEVLIDGFAEFVAANPDIDALLVIPDGQLSRDVGAAKRQVRELGIESRVEWAVPPDPSGFRRHELLGLYAASDVVVNEFGIGWFGFVALEGAAMGKPVLTYVDDDVMSLLYEQGHPFCNARTPTEIADWLTELARDDELRVQRGKAARRWVVEHHSGPSARQRYAGTLGRVAEQLAVRPSDGQGPSERFNR